MAHKTKAGGTAYEISGGKCKVNGTAYDVKKGRTKVGGTGYDVSFASLINVTMVIQKTTVENISTHSSGTIYFTQTQSIVVPAEAGMTYADLAASSEYNTFSPIEGGHSVAFVVDEDTGCPGVLYTSCKTGETAYVSPEGQDRADEIVLVDGMTLDVAVGENRYGTFTVGSNWYMGL